MTGNPTVTGSLFASSFSGIGSNITGISTSNIVGYGIGVKFFASSVGPITISIGFNPYGQRFLHLMDSQ